MYQRFFAKPRHDANKTVAVYVPTKLVDDDAGSAPGVTSSTPKTGLTDADISRMAYFREGDSVHTVVTPATPTLGIQAEGGFILIDDTAMPGLYELSLPNAMLNPSNEAGWAILVVSFAATVEAEDVICHLDLLRSLAR